LAQKGLPSGVSPLHDQHCMVSAFERQSYV
jgi:hypothetical protein